MTDLQRSFSFVCAAVLVLALAVGGCASDPDGREQAAVNEPTVAESGGEAVSLDRPLPEIAHATLQGDSLFTSDLKGKITLINFWATWCGPCIVETPELIGLREEWKDRPFEIVGVSMDEEGFDAVGPFAEEFGMNYPQIIDHGSLADAMGGVYGLPTTFVVDSDGRILTRRMGLFPVDDVRPELERMLNELESTP